MGLTRIGVNATVGQPIPPSLEEPSGAKRMRPSVRYGVLLFAGCPALLGAQGFGIYEDNSCAMARAGVTAATPCPDGSAIFFSPAGLAGLSGPHVTAGVTLIQASGALTDDALERRTALDHPPIAVPRGSATHALSPTPPPAAGGHAL